jgi:hypothetical protein
MKKRWLIGILAILAFGFAIHAALPPQSDIPPGNTRNGASSRLKP